MKQIIKLGLWSIGLLVGAYPVVGQQRPISPVDTTVYACNSTFEVIFKIEEDNNDDSYQWQKTGFGNGPWVNMMNETNASYSAVNIAPPGERYRVLIKLNGGNDTIFSQVATLKVTSEPFSPQITGNQKKCKGISTIISAVNPNGFMITWTGPNGFTAMGTSVSIVEPGNYNIFYQSTNQPNCTANLGFMIEDFPVPTVEIQANPSFSVCENSLIQLKAVSPTATNYQWEGPASGAPTTSIWSIGAAVEGEYKVKVTDSNGCMAIDSVNIATLSAPIIEITPSELIICQGQHLSLGVEGSGYTAYQWSGPGNFFSTSTNPVVSNPIPGIYAVTVTAQNTCTATAQKMADYPPGLSVVLEPSLPSVCEGETVKITINPTFSNYQYKWSDGSNGPFIDVTEAGTYTVTITGNQSCSAVHEITVEPGIVDFEILAPSVLCGQSSFIIKTTDPNAALPWKWNWEGPEGRTSTNAIFQITNLAPGTHQFYVTVTNGRGCTGKKEVTITLLEKPQVVIEGPSSVCSGAINQIYTVAGAFDTYEWKVVGGENNATNNQKAFANITWQESSSTHWVSVKASVGNCTDSDTLIVDINNDKALPQGYIFLKPSGDILIFAKDTVIFPMDLNYEWGALRVTDAMNGIVEEVALPTIINGIPISSNKQYYYIEQVDTTLVYYVKISTGNSACETWCFYPDNPYLRLSIDKESDPEVPKNEWKGKIYPNPNTGGFTASLPIVYNGEVTYRLMSAAGVVAATGRNTVLSGECRFDFPAGHWPPGFYFLVVAKENFGLQTTLRIIIID
jgi:hypothetical protein